MSCVIITGPDISNPLSPLKAVMLIKAIMKGHKLAVVGSTVLPTKSLHYNVRIV